MNTLRNTKLNGFTLIELLVVISIIAVLMAIMMPALSKVKAQAKKTICLSNCKQWCAAVVTYTAENNGKFPTRCAKKTGNYWQGWPTEYYGAVGASDTPYIDIMTYFLKFYIQDQKDFICPAVVRQAGDDPRNYTWEEQIKRWQRVRGDYSFFFGYEQNRCPGLLFGDTAGRYPSYYEKIASFEPPTRMSNAMSGMAVVGDGVMYSESDTKWLYTSPHPTYKFHPSVKDYKPDGMCSGFADGHAQWVEGENVVPFMSYNGGVFYWSRLKQ
jgi:prepilin-type N-terminal cleavage/methylation domain-containing protein